MLHKWMSLVMCLTFSCFGASWNRQSSLPTQTSAIIISQKSPGSPVYPCTPPRPIVATSVRYVPGFGVQEPDGYKDVNQLTHDWYKKTNEEQQEKKESPEKPFFFFSDEEDDEKAPL